MRFRNTDRSVGTDSSSYVDPRVVENFEQGRTVDPDAPAEQAVMDLLTD